MIFLQKKNRLLLLLRVKYFQHTHLVLPMMILVEPNSGTSINFFTNKTNPGKMNQNTTSKANAVEITNTAGASASWKYIRKYSK